MKADKSGQKMGEKSRERLQARAINALLSSPSLERAAQKVHVCSKTLSRWLADPEFRAAYETKKRDYLRAGLGNLTRKVFDAGEILAEVAHHRGRKYQGPRTAAASSLIKLAMDAAILEDLQERIAKLEKQGQNENSI
ncbi:MAG: hypothetical protein ABSG77_13870 [Candidatus Acidiferrum sp.]